MAAGKKGRLIEERVANDWYEWGDYSEWQDRQGHVHKWRDIDCAWGWNIVRMLKRDLAKQTENYNAAWSALGFYTGEYAQMSVEQDTDHLSDNIYNRKYKIHVISAYLKWREENCCVHHAPRSRETAE